MFFRARLTADATLSHMITNGIDLFLKKKMELLSMFYSGVTNGGYGDGDVSSLFSVRSGKDFRRDHCLY